MSRFYISGYPGVPAPAEGLRRVRRDAQGGRGQLPPGELLAQDAGRQVSKENKGDFVPSK